MTQNSMAQRASQAYRGTAVAVPPLKAVVMLLDGASTYLQKSMQAHEEKHFDEGHKHLTRATAILRGLSHNLDFSRGGAVAERLFETYNALILASLRSYGRPYMRENFHRINAGIVQLRDAWGTVETAVKSASGSTAGAAPKR
jgi:flagellar secretion chaperone FliS